MDRGVLVVGGMFIIAGGVWYLLEDYFKKKNGNGTTCSTYTSQTECESHNCYWYNGSCHSTPEGVTPCTVGITSCHPGITGLRQCDAYKNLCECDGNNWNLIQKEHDVCVNNIYYLECFNNLEGKRACLPHMWYGTDNCEGAGLPFGCDCDPNDGCAHAYATCEPTIKKCVMQAIGGIPISATKSDCTCSHPGAGKEYCYYSLERTYFANKLMGTFSYDNMFPYMYGLTFQVYAGLEEEYKKIYEYTWHWAPPSAENQFQANFAEQGIDTLLFVLDPQIGEPHMKSFFGTLSYP